MNLKHGKLLDPRADLVFRKIFGQHPDLVKSFLNSLLPLPDDGLIDTVDYLPSEQVPRTPLQKYSIVDVRCRDQQGRIFIVEMQMGWSSSFQKRLQFGASKAYVEQLQQGEQYHLLNPVYGLALVSDIFKPETEEWYHHYKMVNVKDTKQTIEGLELVFVELSKFKATTPWERKLGVLWLRFLNEISTMDAIPDELSQVCEISKAIQLTQEASFTKEELAQYDGYWDLVSIEKSIRCDAERVGVERGREEGLAEGREAGILQERQAMARRLLNKNTPLTTICELLDISAVELEIIKAKLGS
jgi:predicted transposase/invertase (TIGR01784 family)